jgi:hypothetical protein
VAAGEPAAVVAGMQCLADPVRHKSVSAPHI